MRSGYCLPVADFQRPVRISCPLLIFRNKPVSGDPEHGLEHFFFPYGIFKPFYKELAKLFEFFLFFLSSPVILKIVLFRNCVDQNNPSFFLANFLLILQAQLRLF
jgi:hypothetical protein